MLDRPDQGSLCRSENTVSENRLTDILYKEKWQQACCCGIDGGEAWRRSQVSGLFCYA